MAQINGRESLLYLKPTERQEQTKHWFILFESLILKSMAFVPTSVKNEVFI